ncbi:MAG TPA: hypothetical protein ENH00_14860 [Actinobacteria bacterium]|nr:hypothetical protein [Actinomycetota bacterium]
MHRSTAHLNCGEIQSSSMGRCNCRSATGPVYCTTPTRDLCEVLLPDSGYLQEEDARSTAPVSPESARGSFHVVPVFGRRSRGTGSL